MKRAIIMEITMMTMALLCAGTMSASAEDTKAWPTTIDEMTEVYYDFNDNGNISIADFMISYKLSDIEDKFIFI